MINKIFKAITLSIMLMATPALASPSEEIANSIMPSVGELASKGQFDDKFNFICTVSKVGPAIFLTAGHCVASQEQNSYQIRYGKQYLDVTHLSVSVNNRDNTSREDWALLYTKEDVPVPHIPLECKDNIKVGQQIVTAGFPFPAGKSYFEGYISSTAPLKINGGGDFFTDLQTGPGASGSPVIDRTYGRTIGILITMIIPGNRHLFTGVQTVQTYGLCGVNE